MGDFTFRKGERLQRRRDFERALREGRRFRGKGFTVVVLRRDDLSNRRIGIIVSRRIKGSVKRNRVKRLVREFFRLNKERFPPSSDIVVIIYDLFKDYWEVVDLFTPLLETVRRKVEG